jgi:hypothetical protein
MEWELKVGGVVDLEDVLSLARRVGIFGVNGVELA